MKQPNDWLTYVIWGCGSVCFGIFLMWMTFGATRGFLAFAICGGLAVVLAPIDQMRKYGRASMSPEEEMREKVRRGLRDKY